MNQLQAKAAYQTFILSGELNSEHLNFFNKNGFIHFKHFLTREETASILQSIRGVHEQWIGENKTKVRGIPIVYGEDENGHRIVQRSPFTSIYSHEIRELLQSGRLNPLLQLLPAPDARFAENEKDGVVVNHYVNHRKSGLKQMGWHTDSARDIFYFHKVQPMLNVGIYLTDSNEKQGGLRVLPGSHRQGIHSLLFRKKQFISMREDKDEVLVEAEAGDLVIHNGAIWHRVAMSPVLGPESRRITMYIPIISGKAILKSDQSKTPFYHKLRFLAKK